MKKKTTKKKKLYAWGWNEGGFNQTYAFTKKEALKYGKDLGDGVGTKLTVNLATFRLVKETEKYWDGLELFD